MTIDKARYETIINDINVGNSVAELDSLLDQARVETPIFDAVLNDKYDIVAGRKGAGKTAMFRIVAALSSYLLKDRSLIILTGVNSSGEPVFSKFQNNFSNFSEQEFENFWKLYLVSVVYNEFIKNPLYEARLAECAEEIEQFKKDCYDAGIPDIPIKQDRPSIIATIMARMPRVTAKATMIHDGDKPNLFTTIPEVSIEPTKNASVTTETKAKESVYVNKIGMSLKKILSKSGFKIWIILDRLDEVFDRYSLVEFNGLRGLLRAYKSFEAGQDDNLFRIKLFLRDDIKMFLTDAVNYKKFFPRKQIQPLAAATHIFAKESPTLSWSEEEIEQLILNRLLLSTQLKEFLGLGALDTEDVKGLLRFKKNRKEYWDKIFPEKIQASTSLRWIFSHLKDSNNVVTPRTVIDMLEGAVDFQKRKNQVDLEDCAEILPVEALKAGLEIASKYKLEKDIYNEFPKEQVHIKKLEKEGSHKLTKVDLKRMFGDEWEEIVEDLKRIGILRYIKDSDSYGVVSLFRPALGITYKY